jgi:hypothetical protein
LQSDGEQIVAERSAQPLGGRVPFSALTRGQTLCDPWTLELPSSLAPGVYSLVVGQREPDGAWSQMRRGMLPLGSSYPLATIRVLGRPLDLEAPAVQHPLQADFGGAIRLMGFESDPPLDSRQDAGTTVHLTLHWQALAPTMAPYKLFVHLVGDGGPGDIRTQADQFPRIPTSGWQAGEYLSEQVALDLPAELEPERYSLLIGWYEEASGRRLPVASGAGVVYPDAVELARIDVGD